MTSRRVQLVVTVSAIALVVVHAVWPEWTIDGVTLGLLLIAVLPWLAPLFKTLELPGGWKIEFRDLQRARDRADEAGLLSPSGSAAEQTVYLFQAVAEGDANLALAGLQIEIEKRLRELARTRNLRAEDKGTSGVLRGLGRRGLLNPEERGVLGDMLQLFGGAVHGAAVDPRAATWALEVGPLLLQTLDERIAEQGGRGVDRLTSA